MSEIKKSEIITVNEKPNLDKVAPLQEFQLIDHEGFVHTIWASSQFEAVRSLRESFL